MTKYEHKFLYCASCGRDLESKSVKQGEPDRLVCRGCGQITYLDPKLAACGILEMDGKVVLLKRAIEPEYGKWVIPGGYVDRGEVVTVAMVREMEEETGLIVRADGLVGLYSYPGEATVVAVYRAEYISGRLEALDETLEAALFAPGEIPWDELAFQSTKDSLTDYFSRS